LRTNAFTPAGSSKISNGGPHEEPGGLQVAALELISVKLPLFKSVAKELTLFPTPLFPWVNTYKIPVGRDEELPQLSRNKLRAHIAASATSRPIFFDICTPSRFPPAGISRPLSR
jgi:hypothetical protein